MDSSIGILTKQLKLASLLYQNLWDFMEEVGRGRER